MPKSKGDTIRGIMVKTKTRAKATDKYNQLNIEVRSSGCEYYTCVCLCFSPLLISRPYVTSAHPIGLPEEFFGLVCKERVPPTKPSSTNSITFIVKDQ